MLLFRAQHASGRVTSWAGGAAVEKSAGPSCATLGGAMHRSSCAAGAHMKSCLDHPTLRVSLRHPSELMATCAGSVDSL